MNTKDKRTRDKFTFSLRGMTATGSFFIPPVIADDAINKAWDEKLQSGSRECAGTESAKGAWNWWPGRLFSRSAG